MGCPQRQQGSASLGNLLALAACVALCLAYGDVELPGAVAGTAPASSAGRQLAEVAHSASSSGNSTHDSHAVHVSGAVNPSIFFLITFFCSAVAQFITTLLPHEIRLPHSVLLYFIGTFMAWVALERFPHSEYGKAIGSFATLDPHIIFWVFLPALLYEDAAGSDFAVIQRVLPSALLLALPGVIINTVMTGAFIRYCMYDWNWWMSLLLGSILSATDPVAVVGALSALGAPAKLSHLISGESLFNDGSAVALFQIFLNVAGGKSSFNFGNAIGTLCQLAIGGPAFGFAVAFVACLWLKRARKLNIQVLVILCCVYGTFFIGEYYLKVSGVLAVVVLGLYMAAIGRYSLNVGVEHQYHSIIGFLALISHESIFIIGGVIGYRFLSDGSILWRDVLDLALLYVAIHVTRTLVIAMFWPLLSRMGYGLTVKEAIICIFGGLRGAVGLAMASVAAGDWELGNDNPYAKRIGFHTAGIVVLTLIINGTTITPLYKWLKVDPTKGGRHHEKLLKAGLEDVDEQVKKVIEEFREHWFFHNCDFEIVEALVPKVSEMVQHDKLDFFEKIQHLAKKRTDVDKVFEDLAKKFAEKLHDDPNAMRLHASSKMERQRSKELKDDREQLNFFAARRFAVFHKGSTQNVEGENEELMSEVYQTVSNAVAAEYDAAYEEQVLPTAAYRVLQVSLQYQEKAIYGELGLPEYGVPYPSFLNDEECEIQKLADKPRSEQMKGAFFVGWYYLEKNLSRPRHWHHRQLSWLVGKNTISLDWVLLTRNIFILLQYANSIEHILLDTNLFDGFNDMLHGPLKKARDQAMTNGMEKLMFSDLGMFIILEHCLLARQVLVHMRHIVDHQHKEGTLSQEDAKRIHSEIVKPSEIVLEEFLPSKKHLVPLQSSSTHKARPWLDRFLFDLVLERATSR